MFINNSTSMYFKFIPTKYADIYGIKTQKLTQKPPFFTTSKEIGLKASISVVKSRRAACWKCFKSDWQLRVLVHSPYELPDIRHKNFIVNKEENFRMVMTSQLKITDATLLGLDADE